MPPDAIRPLGLYGGVPPHPPDFSIPVGFTHTLTIQVEAFDELSSSTSIVEFNF